MELLIPGLILVALMVYASTRIKRSAAAAFEPETVETDDYVIQKPEGFLNVIGGSRYAFEAYSREYGTGEAEKFRQATATLTIDGGSVESMDSVTAERNEIIGGNRYHLVEATRHEAGIKFVVLRRSVEKDGKSYMFEVVRLAETSDEFARKTEELAESFSLK